MGAAQCASKDFEITFLQAQLAAVQAENAKLKLKAAATSSSSTTSGDERSLSWADETMDEDEELPDLGRDGITTEVGHESIEDQYDEEDMIQSPSTNSAVQHRWNDYASSRSENWGWWNRP